jgi:hypothetical protein
MGIHRMKPQILDDILFNNPVYLTTKKVWPLPMSQEEKEYESSVGKIKLW